jgi:hypothetical protein
MTATDADITRSVLETIDGELQQIRTGLSKEGADLQITVDVPERRLVATLVRNRITCEGCLLPADLVKTMLTRSLKGHPEGRKYKVETVNWLL